MTKTELLQTMTPTTAEPTPVQKALAKAGIPPDTPYYQGACFCIEQALKKKGNPDAVHFWEEYGFSLCKQLQHMETDAGRETVQAAIKTVKAILIAINI